MKSAKPRADWLVRASLATAAATAAIHGATFVGLTSLGVGGLLYVFHVIVMALFGAVFVRIYRHSFTSARRTQAEDTPRTPPSWLVAVSIVATIYGVALVLSIGTQLGEGYPRAVPGGWAWMNGDAVIRAMTEADYRHFFALELRTFSSWWLFFSLITCCGGYAYGERPKALPESRGMDERGNREVPGVGPKTLLWTLVAGAVAGQVVVVVGVARGAELVWRLGAAVEEASLLALVLRFMYRFDRRFFGRGLARATTAFMSIGFVSMQVASVAQTTVAPQWLRSIASGLDAATWVAFLGVPVVAGWTMFRASQRGSGR